MSRFVRVMFGLLIGLSVAGCTVGVTGSGEAGEVADDEGASSSISAGRPKRSSSGRADGSSPAVRVTASQAMVLIRDAVASEQRPMQPEEEFPVVELSVPGLFEEHRIQLFQVTAGMEECSTYAVRGGAAELFVAGLGGNGLHSLELADVDKNGLRDLIYASSWGSGEHMTDLGWCQVGADSLIHRAIPVSFVGDLYVKRSGATLVLEIGEHLWRYGKWKPLQRFGRIVATSGGPVVELDPGLSEEQRVLIWFHDDE